MADPSDIGHYSGPFSTDAAAAEHAFHTWGDGYSVLWRRANGYYVNDGIDPDSGVFWVTMPEGAGWILVGLQVTFTRVDKPIPKD